MEGSAERCAREIIDVVPAVVQAIRVEMRAQRLHELSVPQFRTLAYIGRHPGCSLSEVAELIGLTLPSMSVLVNGLVGNGFVLRETSPFDRRRVTLTLTKEGNEVHQRALQGATDWLADLLSPLSPAQRIALFEGLEALRPVFDVSPLREAVSQE